MREVLRFADFWSYAGDLSPRYRDEIPYWCLVWPGSRLLADYCLRSTIDFSGMHILEIGCGSGLASVAFASRGASVVATDHDPDALAIADSTGRKNKVKFETAILDLFAGPTQGLIEPKPDLVVMGDLFYEREVANRANLWCNVATEAAIPLLVADPLRSYGPARKGPLWQLKEIQRMDVPVHREIENVRFRTTALLANEAFLSEFL